MAAGVEAGPSIRVTPLHSPRRRRRSSSHAAWAGSADWRSRKAADTRWPSHPGSIAWDQDEQKFCCTGRQRAGSLHGRQSDGELRGTIGRTMLVSGMGTVSAPVEKTGLKRLRYGGVIRGNRALARLACERERARDSLR
ncbi:MAG TPA: hypothetical protein VK504_19245, partial [Vicinamibacterales bacterium]|nr:hypothetical protein [Vicinamibacterales bacterium]